MHRSLATIVLAALLGSAQSSLGVLASGPMCGLGFQFQGDYYGVYDQYTGIDEVTRDGTDAARFYWSGVALGPLGQFGETTRRPWVRETGLLVAVVVSVLAAAIVLRRVGGRVRVST